MIPASFEKCRAYILAQPGTVLQGNALRPTVTISRETGAGALIVAELVAGMLHEREKRANGPWAVFDRNLVTKVLEDHDLPKRLEEFIIEDRKSLISDTVEDLLGLHPPTSTLIGHMIETIIKLGQAGGVVLVGRGAHLITAGFPNALHVRLVAPLEKRIEHVAEHFKLSHRNAGDYVADADRARDKYVHSNFRSDVKNSVNYDLVLNTGSLGHSEAARIIADAAMARVRSRHGDLAAHG